MRDIRFISIADAIEVLHYFEVEDSSPRTLKVIAMAGMGYANRVYINGLGVDDFTILSNTSLLVTVPESAQTLTVGEMEVSVTSSRLTSRDGRTSLSFGPTRVISSVSGIQKLVQQVVKTLLSDVSSNRFSLADGGGLVRDLGSVTFDQASSNKIAASIQASIANTASTIMRHQMGQLVPAEEKLLSLEISTINFDDTTGTASASVRLVSYAGINFTIPLSL